MARSTRTAGSDGDWKHAGFVGLVFAAVLGTILIAAVLEVRPVGRSSTDPAPQTSPDARAIDAGETAPPIPGPTGDARETPSAAVSEPARDRRPPRSATPPSPSGSPLDDRASRDADRLARSGAGWTLQFLMACDPKNVLPWVERLGTEPEFFVLPKPHGDRTCYRVLWGTYDSRDRARAATDAPAALAAIPEPPQPFPLSAVLP